MKLRRRIIVFAALALILIISSYLFYREGTLPVDKSNTSSKIFVVNRGQSPIGIINSLKKEGLIRNRIIFYLVIRQLRIEKKLQAGDFRLSPSMNAYQIAQNLTHGSLDVWITIIEGLRKEEVAKIIAQNLDIPETEFIKIAQEGYLFPDSYLIPRDATTQAVINILDTNFDRRFKQAQNEVTKKNNLIDEEVLTLASLIEREAKFDQDRPAIANILLRRIREGHKLQVDATVQYALGYQPDQKRWWKSSLSFDDLEVDSPYNTYLNYGLPPGPICSPGLDSIKAALSADGKTPYLFYIHDKTGKTHYARNSEEHQRNIDRYLK